MSGTVGRLVRSKELWTGIPQAAPGPGSEDHSHAVSCPFADSLLPRGTARGRCRSTGPGDEALPPWASALGRRPVVYVTLGTVTNDRLVVVASIKLGLCELPFDLVVAVGHEVHPARFGTRPADGQIVRYIAQTPGFDGRDAVATDGGFGTLIAAHPAGLPLVRLPQQGGRRFQAERALAVGLAVVVAQREIGPELIRTAAEQVRTTISAIVSGPAVWARRSPTCRGPSEVPRC